MAKEARKGDGTEPEREAGATKRECFVIMPISDPAEYGVGHFARVYEDIFAPACRAAGFEPIRADQVRATNMIHLEILQRLLDAELVLCDLSSRNPNVLFELGLRQAFDKPVVLVQDERTPQIFDITPLRWTSYRGARLYHEVLEDQLLIANAIRATCEAIEEKRGINSLVRLLQLGSAASLPSGVLNPTEEWIRVLLAEVQQLRSDVSASSRRSAGSGKPRATTPDQSVELFIMRRYLCDVLSDVPDDARERALSGINPLFRKYFEAYLDGAGLAEIRRKMGLSPMDVNDGFEAATAAVMGVLRADGFIHEHVSQAPDGEVPFIFET